MQRVLAMLLVVFLSFSLVSPALFAAEEDSKLPAAVAVLENIVAR